MQLIPENDRRALLQALGFPITPRIIKYTDKDFPEALQRLDSLKQLLQQYGLGQKVSMVIWTVQQAAQESNRTTKFNLTRIAMGILSKVKELTKEKVGDSQFFKDIEVAIDQIRTILRDAALVVSGRATVNAPAKPQPAPIRPATTQPAAPAAIPHVTPASYHSAGILPYAVDDQNNIWLLVGLEPGRNNQAFDFGGKKDPEDNNNSAFTAAREGSEELLFIYDEDEQEFQRILNLGRTKGKNFDISKANSRTFTRILDKINDKTTTFSTTARGYITYLVQVTYRPDEAPQLFAQRRQNYGKQLPIHGQKKIT